MLGGGPVTEHEENLIRNLLAKWRVKEPGVLYRLLGEIAGVRLNEGEAGGTRVAPDVYVIVFKGDELAESADQALRNYHEHGGGSLTLPLS